MNDKFELRVLMITAIGVIVSTLIIACQSWGGKPPGWHCYDTDEGQFCMEVK